MKKSTTVGIGSKRPSWTKNRPWECIFNLNAMSLNLGLLAIAGGLCWMVGARIAQRDTHEYSVLNTYPFITELSAHPNPMPAPIRAKEYNLLVRNNLFSPDRNPDPTVTPKTAPLLPPPPPMPPLPAYHGVMIIGDPVVLLKPLGGSQRKYHVGDMVGLFELVSFDREQIVFKWNGELVRRSPGELKEPDEAFQQVAVSSAFATPVNGRIVETDSQTDSAALDKFGADTGVGVRLCATDDKSPLGTEISGYRKQLISGAFGTTCLWQATTER